MAQVLVEASWFIFIKQNLAREKHGYRKADESSAFLYSSNKIHFPQNHSVKLFRQ